MEKNLNYAIFTGKAKYKEIHTKIKTSYKEINTGTWGSLLYHYYYYFLIIQVVQVILVFSQV